MPGAARAEPWARRGAEQTLAAPSTNVSDAQVVAGRDAALVGQDRPDGIGS